MFCGFGNICIIPIFQEKQQQMEELNAKEEELLKGNPLLNAPTSFNVKRRLASFDILFLHESLDYYINCWRQSILTIILLFSGGMMMLYLRTRHVVK